jgi:hypothetical protein
MGGDQIVVHVVGVARRVAQPQDPGQAGEVAQQPPDTRGAEVSRPVAKLLAEADRLVAGGARELTLIGQSLGWLVV